MPKPWKHPRSGVYWFRREVPKDCREFVGKSMWQKSLGTTSRTEAERLILPFLAETNRTIEDIRAGRFRTYTDDDLRSWIGDWLASQSQGIGGVRIDPKDFPRMTDEQALHGLLSGLQVHRGITPEGADLDRLQELLFEQADVWRTRPDWVQKGKALPDPEAPDLMTTFESYLRERQPRDKTAGQFRKSITDFLALHEGSIPLNAITKSMVVEYKDLLLRKPKWLTPVQRKLNLRELVKEDHPETISAETVNKALVPLHAVLAYAKDNDLVQVNVAEGVKAKRSKSTSRARLPYSIDDLNRIIPVISEFHDHRYWLPLLGLFAGARLEELAQLTVAEIKTDQGVTYMDIAEIAEGQTVKNLSSIRKVPIHPRLVKLGFLDFVKQRQKSKAKMLFDLTPYRGSYSHSFSKWYGRQRPKFGVNDPRKVFHSLRHNFSDACRESGIETKLKEALQGHSNGSVGDNYGSGYSLKALNRAMKRIRYPGLMLN